MRLEIIFRDRKTARLESSHATGSIVNMLQALTETLLFYHPAVWWLSARIRAEREHCCDVVPVKVCGDPIAYAEALTELEASPQFPTLGVGD